MNRKALEQIVLQLRDENEKLKEENAYLKFELEEIRSKRYKSGKKKPPDDPQMPASLPKKKGGLFGHIGWFRKKPDKIDRVEEVRMSCCPKCGGCDLTECKSMDEHIQEDIVLPKVEAVLYRRHEYYCKNCKRKVVAPLGKNELPNSYIGPKAKALAAFLRYGIKISERDVRELFEKAFNLKIVASSIAGFRYQLKRAGSPLYQVLIESLKKGFFIHADETGWKVDGESRWLWKFSNKNVCVSHIDQSRGQKVVRDILGDKYDGILISDFLSAYNKIITKAKQRCLAHILRDLKKVEAYWHDDAEVLSYVTRLKAILQDAITLHKEYKDKNWDDVYCARREALNNALKDFGFPNPNKRILKRFAKRLERHKGEIFTFLYARGIDHHNNHAEQQIRPDVIFRKITFGNRSDEGAKYHNVITSILQTAKLNGIDAIRTFEDILLRKKQYLLRSAISPPL
ncbi:MAG: IS66 family transposase [Candidatus Omnitrophica bacterium]|nr:IS66 family transposase [Candidatus Omnitrophota bacterium]